MNGQENKSERSAEDPHQMHFEDLEKDIDEALRVAETLKFALKEIKNYAQKIEDRAILCARLVDDSPDSATEEPDRLPYNELSPEIQGTTKENLDLALYALKRYRTKHKLRMGANLVPLHKAIEQCSVDPTIRELVYTIFTVGWTEMFIAREDWRKEYEL